MRRPRAALILAFTVAAALCAATDASAQAKKSKGGAKGALSKAAAAWNFTRVLGTPTLSYRMQTQEDFQISFSCQPENGLLRVISSIGSRGLHPGDGAAIRFRNGKAQFEIAGTAFSTEARTQVDIAGTTKFDPALLEIFRRGETASIEVPGQRRSLNLKDAKAATEAFEKACTRTKTKG